MARRRQTLWIGVKPIPGIYRSRRQHLPKKPESAFVLRRRGPYTGVLYDPILQHLPFFIRGLITEARKYIQPGRIEGTLPEQVVFGYLIKAGFMNNVDFNFQSSQMGGRQETGGQVADFILIAFKPQRVIRVQGDFWHSGSQREAKDLISKMALTARGFIVFDLFEHDIYNEYTLKDRMSEICGVRL